MWLCNVIESAKTFCSCINDSELSLDSLVTVEDIKVHSLNPLKLSYKCDVCFVTYTEREHCHADMDIYFND